MPLRNRVTPLSTIEAVSARGLLMGNRGVLHNEHQELVSQRWRHKSWISCCLEFKDWKRKLMQPGKYTELFFLDEVTALAAGHRPCALCSRERYNRFLDAWDDVFATAGTRPTAKLIDTQLHSERVAILDHTEDYLAPFENVPDFAAFEYGNQVLVKHEGRAIHWTHSGYDEEISMGTSETVRLLTCPSICEGLRSGYNPIVHESVGKL